VIEGESNMFIMTYGNFRVCINLLIAVLEMIVIIYIVSMLPSLAGQGFNFIGYTIISSIIFAGSLGSLFLHEYAHLLAARVMRMPMKGITLSLFGAYTSFDGEPSTAKSSFIIAAAGPLMNIVAGIILYAAHLALKETAVVSTIFFCLSVFNAILSAYNLLPVMPLDGGCMVRSVFWSAGSNFVRSNQLSFNIGNAFIFICFLIGIISGFGSHLIMSVICFVLGLSLGQGAKLAYQQMLTARIFSMLRL